MSQHIVQATLYGVHGYGIPTVNYNTSMHPEGKQMSCYIEPSTAYAAITGGSKSDKRGTVLVCLRMKQ